MLLLCGVLSLASCMRIYADSDLPDLRVEWSDLECPEGGVVSVELVKAGEVAVGQSVASAPCADLRLTIENIDRSKLQVVGVIREADGTVVSQTSEPIDARDGNNQQTYLSFSDPKFGRYQLAWSFVPGSSCATVGATYVTIELILDDAKTFAEFFPCSAGKPDYLPLVEAGTYTVLVSAILLSGPRLATAPPLVDVVIAPRGEVTELGTVQLAPCTGTCMP
jgi:hypothetical protein